jgi:enoyl-CoA hydratase
VPPTADQQVIARRIGRLGRITLNRPEKINALTLDMIAAVQDALDLWAGDADVELVLIDGAGERGLCAGGDIAAVYRGITAASDQQAIPPRLFWADEYRMNLTIAQYRKPVVALMDGIVMGGGLGISGHASVRIVTETAQVAMPETAIGLSPDVGGLYLLSRAPGLLGTHAALTGARLGPADAIAAGLADHFVPRDRLPALVSRMPEGVAALPVVRESAQPPPDPGRWPADREWINACYAAARAVDILRCLRSRPEPAAQQAARTLAAMSPTAVAVTLRAIRNAAAMTLAQVLDQDLLVSAHFLHHPDFAEGIRARIIDKDRSPRWQPSSLDEVSEATVQSFFAPIDGLPGLASGGPPVAR